MTSPIVPFGGAPIPPGSSLSPSPMGDLPTDTAAFRAELSVSERLLAGEPVAGSPPPEVLDEIAAAGRISRELRETGHEVRFSEGVEGRVEVELADCEGNKVKSMSVSEALQVAAGKPLEALCGKPPA
jgi:hypothetical protein